MIITALAWAAPSEALRDIKGPLSIVQGRNIFLILVVLHVLAILACLAFFLYKRRKGPVVIHVRPAHEIAFEQLEALNQKDLIRQGRIKEYFSEVSDILRHYLENRFSLNAPEMTTEEFLFGIHDYYTQLQETGGSSAAGFGEHKVLLEEFLSACDLVKFAKYSPSTEEINAVYDAAYKFVDQTKGEFANIAALK